MIDDIPWVINFSVLYTRYTILDTRYSQESSIEYRVSRTDSIETVNLHLVGTVHPGPE